MRLRIRFALLSGAVTLFSLLALALLAGLILYRARLGGLDDELDLQAHAVMDSARANATGEPSDDVVQNLYLESGAAAAQVFRDGRMLWQGGLEARETLDPGFPRGVASSHKCDCGGYRVLSLRDGNLAVSVGRPLGGVRDTITDFSAAAALAGGIAVALATVLTAVSVARATAPIESLAARVRDLESDAPIPGREESSEVGVLARALDASLAELRATRAREARFLADAAHELRSPIAALTADLEHTLARPRAPGEERSALERTLKRVSRLKDLAENLLTISRAGAAQPARVKVDLLDLASETVDHLLPLAAAKGIDLEVDGSPAELLGDPTLLARLVENIVANAIKFTAEGGVSVRVQPSGDQVLMTVSDTGIGIAPEEQAGLFEAFSRANPRQRGGFGLGLAVARSVCAVHGGKISLSSQPGRGTSVSVSIPARTAATASPPAAS